MTHFGKFVEESVHCLWLYTRQLLNVVQAMLGQPFSTNQGPSAPLDTLAKGKHQLVTSHANLLPNWLVRQIQHMEPKIAS
jgi:hypothetical protein